MENKIHRALVSAYCTLMLSSAFLTVGDGALLAGAASGFSSIETQIAQRIEQAGWSGADSEGSVPQAAGMQVAQAAKDLQPIVRALLTSSRKDSSGVMEADLARDLGIPLRTGEREINIKQQTAPGPDLTRGVMTVADPQRDYVVFAVQTSAELRFYLSDSGGRLKRAIRVVLATDATEAIDARVAEPGFREQIAYWESQLGVGSGVASRGPLSRAGG